VSVVDRDEPVVACSEWHGDGTTGEHDVGSQLATVAPTRAMGEARPGRPEPVGKRPAGVRQLDSRRGRRLLSPRLKTPSSVALEGPVAVPLRG
jgi:hypothetical protein